MGEEALETRRAYFATLFADTKLCVRGCLGKGVGVFVTQAVEPGDVLFHEDATCVFQTKAKPQPLACDHCLCLIGSLDFQMRLLADSGVRPSKDDPQVLPGLQPNERVLPGAQRGWAPWHEEGWFCSSECEAQHKQVFSVLQGQENAVRRFVQHAEEASTQTFVVALKSLVLGDLPGHLMQRPYWECVDLPEENLEEFVATMKSDLGKSWSLLQNINCPGRPGTQDAYAKLVGAMCLNCIAVKYAHPLVLYLQEVDAGLRGGESKKTLAPLIEVVRARQRPQQSEAEASGSEGEEDSDEEDDELEFSWQDHVGEALNFSSRLFPAMKGYGLFGKLAAVNHSCQPNAEAFFFGHGNLSLLATKALAAGDEVCISYIDHEQNTAYRKAALESYGFTCDCPRCTPRKRKVSAGARKVLKPKTDHAQASGDH